MSDNGHDGMRGFFFLNHPEVINDFAFRAIHIEAVLGKQIINAYYKRTHDNSYFMGCSTGGRQGLQSALLFPDDFDGIVAGAPATDFNHLLGWSSMAGRFVSASIQKLSDTSSHLLDWIGKVYRFVSAQSRNVGGSVIPASLWAIISHEILNQCDSLDGLMDGIITEPDECVFRPEALLCDATNGGDESPCLNSLQVAALRQIYQPLFGTRGILYPRYDPGTEGDGNFMPILGDTILRSPL